MNDNLKITIGVITIGVIVMVLWCTALVYLQSKPKAQARCACAGYTTLNADAVILCNGDTLYISAQPWKRTAKEDSILKVHMYNTNKK